MDDSYKDPSLPQPHLPPSHFPPSPFPPSPSEILLYIQHIQAHAGAMCECPGLYVNSRINYDFVACMHSS